MTLVSSVSVALWTPRSFLFKRTPQFERVHVCGLVPARVCLCASVRISFFLRARVHACAFARGLHVCRRGTSLSMGTHIWMKLDMNYDNNIR